MKIVTLTLNPAFDVHCRVAEFMPYHENIAELCSLEAGGKGVNISRALEQNGVKNKAVVIVGADNYAEFCKSLEKDGVSFSEVVTGGRIRENFTLHEEGKPETRISFNGFSCDSSVLSRVRLRIGKTDENTVVTFSGSAPNGLNVAELKRLLAEIQATGAKIVVDSRSFTLDDLLELKPWLIKPNKDETEHYTGKKIENITAAANIARELYNGGVENVVVSLGGDGAVLACADGVFYAKNPKIEAISTIGAGDSLIAGFIDGKSRSLNAEDTLRRAAAYGTAACLQSGTRPPQKSDIDEVEKQVEITRLNA